MVRRSTSKVENHLKIRAHHLLCMEGFQGHGYNENFTENLERIIKALKRNPNAMIKVIDEVDDICRICPHEENGECQMDDKVKIKDHRLLEKFNIDVKEIRGYNELRGLVYEKVDPQILWEICGDCRWTKKCKFYMQKGMVDPIVEK